ncbi:hypothetical protein SDC9_58914 [bioreactor metagenome]|uniref:Uncharacterized protein n=1 Tax=bioreactor metagenome TaxID=1076179 RepID=A0A644X9S0_9ZZZZ
MRITSDSGILLANPVDYVYHNFSSTKGYSGYGFRSWNGHMQYKHKGGIWADFPTMPSIPGNVEWWIRPTAALYIRPISNDYIRVWDNGQTYGLSYDGGGNLIGGYFRITNTTLGAAAVQGFSDVSGNQTYGYLGYNDNITVGSTTVGGAAVHGRVDDPNRTAVYGRTAGLSDVAAMLGYSNVWIASYNWTDNASATYNPPAIYGHLSNNTGSTVAGDHIGVRGLSQRSASGNPGYTIGVGGVSLANSEDGHGVDGYYSGTGTWRRGGVFYADNTLTSIEVSVAAHDVNRKVVGGGTVSEVIPTENYGRITLTCPESPEYWYIDYGSVQMINGKAHVDLDPILISICFIDSMNPIKVICQPNMEYCNGVAVINKTEKGFDIVEMNGGVHSGEIDFQIVAKPRTNYGEGRFPQAKSRFVKSQNEPEAAKAQNQPDYSKTFRWPNDWEVYGYDVEENTPVGDLIIAGPNAGKIKLGDGKYGTSVPASKSDLRIENK